MADLGLLGALGGLGKGLTQMGEDIIKRRERALEWARQEAIEQRRLAARSEEKAEDRQFRTEETVYRETKADQRERLRQEGRKEIVETQEEARSRREREKREFQRSERQASEAASARQARLTAALSRSNTEYATRLRDQLGADDTTGVKFGPVRNGYSQVFRVTKTGRLEPTGQSVHESLVDEEDDEL